MLILSRWPSEVVVIQVPGYPPIEVVVVDVRGDRVRLGFNADRSITIHRREVLERIQRGETWTPKTKESNE